MAAFQDAADKSKFGTDLPVTIDEPLRTTPDLLAWIA